MMQFEVPGQEHFRVCYNSNEDGGGTWFGQEYVGEIQRYQRRFGRCLDWCSGPGFIGFALLAHGLCDTVCLQDRHVPLSDSIRHTTQENDCAEQVTFYCCDRVSDLPDHEQFDLVVANPPHYLECPGDANYQRIAVDPDWHIHREFYNHIGSYLNRDSIVLIQENQAGSLAGPGEWQDMIDRAGLRVTGYWTSRQHYDATGPTQIYYMETRLK